MIFSTSLAIFLGFCIFVSAWWFSNKQQKTNENSALAFFCSSLLFLSPLMFFGFTWYDEFFAIGFLIPYCLKIRSVRWGTRNWLLLLFIIYSLFQVIRGALTHWDIFSDVGLVLRKGRWILFFLIIYISSIVFRDYENKKKEQIGNSLMIFALIGIHVLYLLGGVLTQVFCERPYLTQFADWNNGIIANRCLEKVGSFAPLIGSWGATAYVASIIPFAFVILFQNILMNSIKKSKSSYALLYIMMVVSFFYDSRSGIVFFLVFFMTSMFKLKIVRIGLIISIVTISYLTSITLRKTDYNESGDFINVVLRADDSQNIQTNNYVLRALYTMKSRLFRTDDRKIITSAAIRALFSTFNSTLFGYGFRTAGEIVASDEQMYLDFQKLGYSFPKTNSLGVSGTSEFLLSFGLIGALLVITILILNYLTIISKLDLTSKLMYWAMVLCCGISSYAINNSDILLLYFILLPPFIKFLFLDDRSGVSPVKVQ